LRDFLTLRPLLDPSKFAGKTATLKRDTTYHAFYFTKHSYLDAGGIFGVEADGSDTYRPIMLLVSPLPPPNNSIEGESYEQGINARYTTSDGSSLRSNPQQQSPAIDIKIK
jgi:hypothetical protein